jgi:hypothetical protein
LYAKEHTRQKYEDMLNLVGELRYRYRPTKIYCDSANPEFIRSLKVRFSENPDYESIVFQANKEGIDPEYRQFVIPISFSQKGKELLGKLEHLVSKHWLSIPESYIELISQLHSANFQPNGNLDKSVIGDQTYDVFDALRLAVQLYRLNVKQEMMP